MHTAVKPKSTSDYACAACNHKLGVLLSFDVRCDPACSCSIVDGMWSMTSAFQVHCYNLYFRTISSIFPPEQNLPKDNGHPPVQRGLHSVCTVQRVRIKHGVSYWNNWPAWLATLTNDGSCALELQFIDFNWRFGEQILLFPTSQVDY